MFGAKQFDGVGYPTPSSIPETSACRMIQIPASGEWQALVMGLMSVLTDEVNWQQFEGAISRQDAADTWLEIVDSMYASAETEVDACAGENTSPFWDDPDGGDADGSPADNTYTWNERLADWAIAAFVATSGVPSAAMTYLTIAPRFRLFFKTHDAGGIAQILIDNVAYGQVDTYSATPGLLAVDVIVP